MANPIKFFLSYNNGAEVMQLPVNPAEIRVSSSYNWNVVNISQLGEYSIPGGHQLTKITLSSFFPRDYNSSYCEYQNIDPPLEYVNKISRWKELKNPIRLLVTNTWVNYAMTITRFDFWEQAGSPGDIYFELELQEYQFIKLTKVGPAVSKSTGLKTVIKADPKPQRPNERALPTTYTVKSGDTLSKITNWLRAQGVKNLTIPKLYETNKSVIGKNMNVIKPGQVLKVPT